MQNYQKILAAIDLSEQSLPLLKKSLMLLRQHPKKLHVVHVAQHPLTGSGERQHHDITESEILQDLHDSLSQLCKPLNIPLQNQHIMFGAPCEAIESMVTTKSIDLVVVGHHPQHGFRALLGSTADALMKHTSCDVLALQFKSA